MKIYVFKMTDDIVSEKLTLNPFYTSTSRFLPPRLQSLSLGGIHLEDFLAYTGFSFRR